MTDTSFNTTDKKEEGNFSTQANTDTQLDPKSIEGQLEMIQKRLDDKEMFIETLKNENKDFREKITGYEQMSDVNEKIDTLLTRMNNDTSQTDTTGQQNQFNAYDDLKSKGFLTRQELEEEKAQALKVENFNSVKSALVDSYGEDKFMESLENKAKDLGMTMVDVDHLAHTNPTAAIKLFGQEKTQNTSSTTGSINTQAFDKTNGDTPPRPKSVMYGATTSEVTNEWRRVGEQVKQQLEQG